jgi:hypothetical protein
MPAERLVVVVPADLHPRVYPWGPELVCAAVAQNCPGSEAEILDLRVWPPFAAALADYERDAAPRLDGLVRALRGAARSWWDRDAFQPSAVFASTLLLGDGVLDLPRQLGLRARVRSDEKLRACLRSVRDRVRAAFEERYRADSDNGVRLIWGFSPFDCFFSSLAVGKLLKDLFPQSEILWGGSRIEHPEARALVEGPLVDAVLLGPGERPMVNVMRRVRAGERLATMRAERLLNRLTLDDARPESSVPVTIEGAPFNLDFDGVRWDDASGMIHILEDVRCHWSECTFCREADFFQRYEKDFYAPEVDGLVRGLARALEEAARSTRNHGHIAVYIDSDDPNTETIERLARYIIDEAPRDLLESLPPIRLWSYCRVAQMTEEKFHRLAFIRRARRFTVALTIPIESMNPVALQQMIKGNTIVKNIKALKLAKDAGITRAGAFYFTHYPGETFESAAIELDALRRLWHLLPRLLPTYMWASEGSPMGAQQEKFGVRIHGADPHPLTLRLFGTPLSWGSYSAYDLILDGSLSDRQQRSYFDLCKSLGRAADEPSQLRRAVIVGRALVPFLFWQAAGRDRRYVDRAWLFYKTLRDSKHLEPSQRRPPEKNRARFALAGRVLGKDFPAGLPGGGESWRRTLDDDELAVLRYLYHYRKLGEVTRAFAGRISAARVQEILRAHLALGSVFQYGNMVIAVFNDPEFLDSEERQELPQPRLVQIRR